MRQTRAEIDLGALESNFGMIRERIGSRIKISAVVKGNAYGHGIVPVSRKLEKLGIDTLSVAYPQEGIELRKAGIRTPILLIGPLSGEDFKDVKEHDLTPTVYDFESLKGLSQYSRAENCTFRVHLKMDSGMSRLGFRLAEISDLISILRSNSNVHIEGISSHFLESEHRNSEITQAQHGRFIEFSTILEKEFHFKAIKHIANSAAVIASTNFHPDMVRCGLVLYGYSSLNDPEVDRKLKKVLKLVTSIATIKNVSKGDYVGYSRGFIADRDLTIAIIPVGYADGYLRKYSELGYVLIGGTRCKTIGHVCMDMIFCDISHLKSAKIGDEVVLIGSQGKEEISAADYAKACNTIPYEIITSISERVPRVC